MWPDAHLLAEPPSGYRPLDMPAPWEPEPTVTAPQPGHQAPQPTHEAQRAQKPWKYAPYAPAASPPADQPVAPPHTPASGYVISAPYEEAPQPSRKPPAHILRSFRDLRTGSLEGREFATMRDFAVAAVLEAGYSEADVARLFRFARWQLHTWVEGARGASFGPGTGPA